MTEFIIKSELSSKKINALLQILRLMNYDVELKKKPNIKKEKTKEVHFSIGLWNDYSIDAKELRNSAWKKK